MTVARVLTLSDADEAGTKRFVGCARRFRGVLDPSITWNCLTDNHFGSVGAMLEPAGRHNRT